MIIRFYLASSLLSLKPKTNYKMSYKYAMQLHKSLHKSLGLTACRYTSNYLATGGNFFVRHVSAKDMEFVTRETIKEGWHVGPYDYPSALVFDPKGFFVGEIDGNTVCHVSAITYPNHHSYMGGYLVAEQHRGKGYGQKIDAIAYNSLDKNYTIGVDVDSRFKPRFQAREFETLWNTYIAMLSLDKIARILAGIKHPSDILIQPIHKSSLVKLLEYDNMMVWCLEHCGKLLSKHG